MASLTYNAVNFETTLGGLPRISRTISVEVDGESGVVLQERHLITLDWHAIPATGTTDAMQTEITAIEAAIEALPHGATTQARGTRVPLIFRENDNDIAWQYDGVLNSVNNHRTKHGIRILQRAFPWGPAKHVTNDPVQTVLEAVVLPCSNLPVTGVSTLIYSVTEEWEGTGLVSVGFEGRLCVCEDFDPCEVLTEVVQTVFSVEARNRFADAGALNQNATIIPRSATYRIFEPDRRCKAFSFTYGGDGFPSNNLEAETLRVTAEMSIIQNLITLVVRGVYTYRGEFMGSGAAGNLFGIGSGSGNGLFGGALSGVFGIGGRAAAVSFGAVKKEAWTFAGIDATVFLPPNAKSIFLVTEPRLSYDTDAHTITSEKTFYAPWRWHDRVLLFDVSVSIDYSRPGLSWRRLMYKDAGSNPPFAYPQESGLGAFRLTMQATIVSREKWYDLGKLIKEDRTNVYRVEPDSVQFTNALPNQSPMPARIKEGYMTSIITQSFDIMDPSSVSGIDKIPIGSVAKFTSVVLTEKGKRTTDRVFGEIGGMGVE